MCKQKFYYIKKDEKEKCREEKGKIVLNRKKGKDQGCKRTRYNNVGKITMHKLQQFLSI
jgi:hypothetical protein